MNIDLKKNQLGIRILLAFAGVMLSGVAVGFFKRADLGLDPYQCFANGLNRVFPISFGTFYMIVNLIQLILVFFLDRHYIGISTFVNMFLVGYVADFSSSILWNLFPQSGLAFQLIFLVIALIITCIAAALYYTADLGVSTYDAIPLHIADCKPKLFGKVVPFRFVRVISDVICVTVGLIFGLMPGIGTILTAFCMGPLITFFRNTISDPILERAKAA